MFPYRDENETRRPAVVTVAIIAACVLVWIFVQGAGAGYSLAASVCNLGIIPGELTLKLPPGTGFSMGQGLVCQTDPGRQISHILTSMFLHGGWLHLLGNMWFLWVFGSKLEGYLGHGRFLGFYFIGGAVAAGLQVAVSPDSTISTMLPAGIWTARGFVPLESRPIVVLVNRKRLPVDMKRSPLQRKLHARPAFAAVLLLV